MFVKIGNWIHNKIIESLEKPKAVYPEKSLEYHHREAFKQLEKPTIALVRKLKEAIDKEEYNTLIGDDASGRVPTLILRKVMSDRINIGNPLLSPMEKRESLMTYFVSGGQGLSDETLGYLKLFFESIKKAGNKKFLLVTEYIQSGRSASKLADILESAGVNFDIASTFIDPEASEILAKIEVGGHKIFSGSKMRVPPKIWGHEGISGVVNIKTSSNGRVLEAHAVPFVKDLEIMPLAKERQLEIQQDINNAREDVNLLSGRVIKKVWSK